MDWTQVNAFLQEQVAAAAQGKDGRERDAATAEVLSNLAQPIRQFLHDGGHANATAQHKTKIRTLEAEKSALEEQVTAAQARIEEIEKQAPNAEQIKAQYRQEIEQIKATAEALEGQIRSLKTGSFTSRLLGQMGPRLSEDGLDWARTQVERMTLDGRIRPTDAGFEVLQPGKEIPYSATTEDELLSVVAGEVLKAARPWALKSGADGGGGTSGSGSGGPSGGSDWDKLREQAKGRHQQPDQKTLQERRGRLLPT
jgi:hypothetical protein